MAIILKNSWNVPPVRWGSFADVQYAVKVNAEKIYGIDSDSFVLNMPGFWGLPPLDYSGKGHHGINYGTYYKNSTLDYDGNTDKIALPNLELSGATPRTIILEIIAGSKSSIQSIIGWGENVKERQFIVHYCVVSANDIYISFNDNDYYTSINAIIEGERHTLIVSYDGGALSTSSVQININGEEKSLTKAGSGTGSANTTDTGYTLGYDYGTDPARYFDGIINRCDILNISITTEQKKLFNDLPYGLYQKVLRPIYLLPIAVTTAPPTTPTPTTAGPTTVVPTTLAPTTLYPTTIAPTTTPIATTPPPTTAGPTTAYPTTFVPTTLFQTTVGPTTKAPTSLAPTTPAPTSLAPTTSAPTSLAPTSLAPTTSAPTTPVPTTIVPTTSVPTTVAPTSLAPTTLEPTTLAPTSLAPTTSAPTTPVPTTLAPTSLAPTTIAPTTLAPTTSAPTSLAPTTFLTTLAPTTNIPELICVKNLSSIINLTLDAKSTITKEVTLNGNLC